MICAAEAVGGEYLDSPTPSELAEVINDAVTSGDYGFSLVESNGRRPSNGRAGDPVGTAYGNFYDTFVDAVAPFGVFGLDISRSYNSLEPDVGVMGRGWSAPFSESVSVDGDVVWLRLGDGRHVRFESNGAGGWDRPLEFNADLSVDPYNDFVVTFTSVVPPVWRSCCLRGVFGCR